MNFPGVNPERVVLIDDHPAVRAATAQIIEKLENFEVVGSCDSGESGLESIYQLQPSIAIIDISIPGMNGFQVVEALRYSHQTPLNLKVIMLTRHNQQAYLEKLMELGVLGYVLKDFAAEELPLALEQVAHQKTFVSQSMQSSGENQA